jgi:hypothetical protein
VIRVIPQFLANPPLLAAGHCLKPGSFKSGIQDFELGSESMASFCRHLWLLCGNDIVHQRAWNIFPVIDCHIEL